MTLRSNRTSLARKRWQENWKTFYELARVARPAGEPPHPRLAVKWPSRRPEGRGRKGGSPAPSAARQAPSPSALRCCRRSSAAPALLAAEPRGLGLEALPGRVRGARATTDRRIQRAAAIAPAVAL